MPRRRKAEDFLYAQAQTAALDRLGAAASLRRWRRYETAAGCFWILPRSNLNGHVSCTNGRVSCCVFCILNVCGALG